MPNEKNLNRLNALLEAFDNGAVQPEELIEAIDAVMAVLESSQKAAFEKIETTDKKSESELNKVKADVASKMQAVKASIVELNNTKATKTDIEKAHTGFEKEMARIEALIPTLPDEFDATDIYGVLEEQKEVIGSLSELILGENIRNALEAIPEGEKLAIEAIEGLREELDRRVKNAQQTTAIVARKLYQFTDITNASAATDGQVLTANGDGTYTFETPTGGVGGGHTIQDEGTPLTQRANLNFVGAGVTATDDAGNDATVVTIDGASVDESAVYNWTGQHTFTDLRLPTSATPSVTIDGDVALDTSVTGLSHGIQRLFAGEELFNLALPVAQLSALIDGYIPSYNATTDEFELVPAPSGSGDTITTFLNSTYVDSTSGTSDTYGVLAGAVDGVNTTYTVSRGQYVSGKLVVYRNGVRQVQGSGEDWVETTPGSGTFTFNTAPLSGDVIDVEYIDQASASGNFKNNGDTTTVSTNYTALATDENINVNTTSGDVTITLPAIGSILNNQISIKRIDTSANKVIIAAPGSETIDNAATVELPGLYEAAMIYDDGTNYWRK